MTSKIFAISSSLLLASLSAFAQQTPASPAARPAPAPLAIPNPHYITVPLTIDVNAPADKVWARIGKYCDISEWGIGGCKLLSGDGNVGSVRSIVDEVMVAQTQYSYTYTQQPRVDTPFALSHGTVMVEPLTATTSRVSYITMLDDSIVPEENRAASIENRKKRFGAWMQNIKTLVEGGTVPPPAPIAVNPNAPTPKPYLSPNAHFQVIPMEIEVNAPVDKVWARVGKYCDIGEWGTGNCKMLSGDGVELGSVRSVGNEVLVAKTKYSYTYTQPIRVGTFWPNYHGTIEARAKTPTTTTLYYTLVYDNSNLADDAAKQKDIDGRRTRFMGWMKNMKILAEGGTLPPITVGVPVAK